MAYTKGKKLDTGVWRCEDGSQDARYVAEISFEDTETCKRVRRWKTFNRLDLVRHWRRKMQDGDVRQRLGGARKKLKAITFNRFVPEYLESWSLDRKPSTAKGEKKRISGILSPVFGDKVLHTITRKIIDDFLVRRRETVSNATANRDLCRLKNMLRKAEGWGYIESSISCF